MSLVKGLNSTKLVYMTIARTVLKINAKIGMNLFCKEAKSEYICIPHGMYEFREAW